MWSQALRYWNGKSMSIRLPGPGKVADDLRFGGTPCARDRSRGLLLVGALMWVHPAAAQAPGGHEAHHPGQAAGAAGAAQPGAAPDTATGSSSAIPASRSSAMGIPPASRVPPANDVTPPPIAPALPRSSGMGDMMSGMMEGMTGGSGAGTTPLYPSLMTLPALTPEKRVEIERLSKQEIDAGTAQLAASHEALGRALQSSDTLTAERSVAAMDEALSRIQAGIAATRVVSEGKAPRNLALDWFRRELNLATPVAPDGRGRHEPGLSPLHLFAMGLLVAFAGAMVLMYFFKMRRARALFGRLRLEPDPPQSAAPPLPVDAHRRGGASSSPGDSHADTGSTGEVPTVNVQPIAGSPPAPVTGNWRGRLRVVAAFDETRNVKTLRLANPDGTSLPFVFVPGQFLNVAFDVGGGRMNRSYSISSSPNERGYAELTVKREERGAVSRHIHDAVHVGATIEASGPVGRFTFSGTEADSIVLISGGVGITPMMSIARYLSEKRWPGDIHFVHACRAQGDLIFADALRELERHNPRLHLSVTMSAPTPGWTGARGRIGKELLTAIPDIASRRIHLCGPPAMMDSTRALLAEIGVPSDHLKTEAFGAVRPVPGAPGESVKATAPATGPLVMFSRNARKARVRAGQTILELSEDLGIGIQNSCRVGTCGVCKVRLTSGEVEMAVEDALDPGDKANGIILACQAKPRTEVTVEA